MSRRGGCTSVDVEVTCDPDAFFWLVQNAGGGWRRLAEAGAHTAKQPLACCFSPRDGNKRQKINLVSLWASSAGRKARLRHVEFPFEKMKWICVWLSPNRRRCFAELWICSRWYLLCHQHVSTVALSNKWRTWYYGHLVLTPPPFLLRSGHIFQVQSGLNENYRPI